MINFDAAHLRMVIKKGIKIVSSQVWFSLLDRRAAADLSKVAEVHGAAFLAFGTLEGRFLSDKWVGAKELADIANWSQMK